MGVDRPDDAALPVADRRGHGVQPVEELLERPRVTLGDDLGEPRADRPSPRSACGWPVVRAVGRGSLSASIAPKASNTWPDDTVCAGIRSPVQSRLCTCLSESTWSRYSTSKPSAIDSPGRLAGGLGEVVQVRPHGVDQTCGRAALRRRSRSSRPRPGSCRPARSARPCRGLRASTAACETVLFGRLDPVGHVGDTCWPARQAAQHGEGSLDGLHTGHQDRRHQAGNAPCMRAASSVFCSRQAMVIGPVPPGIGVIAPAISETGS